MRSGNLTAEFRVDNIPVEYLQNLAPVFAGDPITASGATSGIFYSDSIAADASDANAGDTLTFSKVSGPGWLTLASNGDIFGDPADSDGGLNSFSLRVTDASGATQPPTCRSR
ncbi:putative Ig domain-containing protein [Luteolibacter arcticus]|uniref:Ig domain-containing protein n=1 Tax=Luteolibacter arcticus TaxID=1581411 RepID=A0ABT3GQ85_9BACT|nr:Ig-like domain-containing protein [Luteolibacter arcticus]MCW1925696.1 putative Ig domain-containing protein [Luteolibacter arcticus]